MASATEPVHLELLLGSEEVAVCSAAPEAVYRAAGRLVEEFRASSGERGMAMEEAEIRAACWPPLVSRLAAMLSADQDSRHGSAGAFIEAALCFLVTLAYRRLRGGERYAVRIGADGKVAVARRPRRLIGRNTVVLGNHRHAVAGGHRSRMAASHLLCLAVLAMLCLSAPTARAESAGPYVHGETRTADQKLIVCLDKQTALSVARAVNGALMSLREEILAAPDDAARQAIYENKLYPSMGWEYLMGAVYEQSCSLVDEADHVSRRTVQLGPPELEAISASHSVIESDMLYGEAKVPLTVWVVTTEQVPPVGP